VRQFEEHVYSNVKQFKGEVREVKQEEGAEGE
jgi:hypothetical protein